MRFIVGSSQPGQRNAVFLARGDRARNLSEVHPGLGSDLMRLINDPALLARIRAEGPGAITIPAASIRPALPIAHPGKVICLGLNYIDHTTESRYDVPEYPAVFLRSLTSLIPSGAPMVRPCSSDQLDYGAELMVIIGLGGRHIAKESALSHVFGYTIFNDGSIRDYQRKTHQWTPGKNFDGTGAIGPVVVTPDELPPGAAGLRIRTRVGTEVLQDANTSDMLWSVACIIATLSEYTTLEAGDLIAMGTPPGVGQARTPPRWLRPGETVEVEIEGIGICTNTVQDEAR